jgi:hypothetical protein
VEEYLKRRQISHMFGTRVATGSMSTACVLTKMDLSSNTKRCFMSLILF